MTRCATLGRHRNAGAAHTWKVWHNNRSLNLSEDQGLCLVVLPDGWGQLRLCAHPPGKFTTQRPQRGENKFDGSSGQKRGCLQKGNPHLLSEGRQFSVFPFLASFFDTRLVLQGTVDDLSKALLECDSRSERYVVLSSECSHPELKTLLLIF